MLRYVRPLKRSFFLSSFVCLCSQNNRGNLKQKGAGLISQRGDKHFPPGAKIQQKNHKFDIKKLLFYLANMKVFTRDLKQKFYNNPVWKQIRRIQLSKYPLCAICEKSCKRTVATVCDHIEPLKWDDKSKAWELFIKGPFQSLCKQCHDDKTYLSDIPKLKRAQKLKLDFF